jgi:hypothetical protein
MFISIFYVFRATMCPSSGEITVSKRYLVFVTVWVTIWYAGWDEILPCIPDVHPHIVTNTKCCTDTVISPDDGHIVARNTLENRNKRTNEGTVHQIGFIYKNKVLVPTISPLVCVRVRIWCVLLQRERQSFAFLRQRNER